MTQEEVIAKVVDVLVELGLPYMVAGSFASNLHGVPRMTQDADVVIDADESSVVELAHALEPDFYVSEDAAREAVRLRRMFNAINGPIFAYGADGARRRLTSVAEWTQTLAMAPDGRDLLAGVSRAGRHLVVLVSTAEGEERTLVEGDHPQFTPDGAEVVYLDPATPGRIEAVAREGGASRHVGVLPGQVNDLRVGPTGPFTSRCLQAKSCRRGASPRRGALPSARRPRPGPRSFRHRPGAGARCSCARTPKRTGCTSFGLGRAWKNQRRTRSGHSRWPGTGTARRWSTSTRAKCTVSASRLAPIR